MIDIDRYCVSFSPPLDNFIENLRNFLTKKRNLLAISRIFSLKLRNFSGFLRNIAKVLRNFFGVLRSLLRKLGSFSLKLRIFCVDHTCSFAYCSVITATYGHFDLRFLAVAFVKSFFATNSTNVTDGFDSCHSFFALTTNYRPPTTDN